MISVIASLVIGQAAPVMTADAIREKLEYPITMRTDPVRLAVALDEVGARVGIRIRCESELQSAVVVVGVRNKPAKEVVKHLVDGVGAGTIIQNGTMIVGMQIHNEKQSGEQRDLELRAIRGAVEQRATQFKIDEPIDPQLAAKTAGLALAALQNPESGVRVPYQLLYQASQQSPLPRVAIGLMRAVGPENLRVDEGTTKVVSMRYLTPDQAKKAQSALSKFGEEQASWSATFSSVLRLSAANPWMIGDELAYRSSPIGSSKPDDFTMAISNTESGRAVEIEVLADGDALFEYADVLPRRRIYTNPGGENFPASKAQAIRVPLGKSALYLAKLQTAMRESKPIAYDPQQVKLIADTWKNEPIAITWCQPLADVAEKLGLNVVAYLGDRILANVVFGMPMIQADQVPGDQILSYSSSASYGFRKKGDWLLGYCANPEQYLRDQIDRIALGRFLTKAVKPGALTFEQFLSARKDMSLLQLYTARNYARIVRPGFDSLNPVNMEVLEIVSALSPGDLRTAETVGIPYSSLPASLQKRMGAFIGYQQRRPRYPSDDSIDAPLTSQDVRQSRMYLGRTSKFGVMALAGAEIQTKTYNPYISYSFRDFDQFRGFNAIPPILEQFQNQNVWLARMDSLNFRLEIQRRRPHSFSTSQYVTDITTDPLTPNQLGGAIESYFRGG